MCKWFYLSFDLILSKNEKKVAVLQIEAPPYDMNSRTVQSNTGGKGARTIIN